jgi:hypothetical protein
LFEQVGGYATISKHVAPSGTEVTVWFGDTVVGCASVSSRGDFVMTVYGADTTAPTASYPKEGDSLTMRVNAESAVVTVSSGAVMGVHYPTLRFENQTSWLVHVDAADAALHQSASGPNVQLIMPSIFIVVSLVCLAIVLWHRPAGTGRAN